MCATPELLKRQDASRRDVEKMEQRCGWGAWIRTKTGRVRVCSATVTPRPIIRVTGSGPSLRGLGRPRRARMRKSHLGHLGPFSKRACGRGLFPAAARFAAIIPAHQRERHREPARRRWPRACDEQASRTGQGRHPLARGAGCGRCRQLTKRVFARGWMSPVDRSSLR